MYNILVVDDETRERNIVKILIKQKYEGQFNINESSSGEEAIKILEEGQADILFIDIQMPGISGLEAVRKIREKSKQLYIIILTAYNYFEYAKEAIDAGVNDFLLKPLIREDLEKALNKFFQYYDEKHFISSAENEGTHRLLSKELVSLISFSSKNDKEIQRYLNLLNIKEKEGYCVIFEPIIKSSNEDIAKTQFLSLMAYLENCFKKEDRAFIINKIGGKIVTYNFIDHTYNQQKENQWLHGLVKNASEYIHMEVLLGKGRVCDVGIELYTSFTEALEQLNHSIVDLNTKDYEKLVSKNIREKNVQKAIAIIKDLILEMSKNNPYDKIKFKIIGILTQVTKKTLDNEMQAKLLDELSFIIEIKEMENLLKFIDGFIFRISQELEKIYEDKSHYVIDQIVRYIQGNYNKPLSIEELAVEFSLSSFYLSKLFKDYQKVCFTDYVTNIRVDKAIELMKDSSKNIKNIAYEVGYHDANYFSRVFKKKMGIGPKEYRKYFLKEDS